MTSKDEVKIIRAAIKCYEKATGAKLNIEKLSVLAVGNWDTSCDVMGIPYKEENNSSWSKTEEHNKKN